MQAKPLKPNPAETFNLAFHNILAKPVSDTLRMGGHEDISASSKSAEGIASAKFAVPKCHLAMMAEGTCFGRDNGMASCDAHEDKMA